MNRPIFASLLLTSALAVQAQVTIEVTIETGADDLRGGSVASLLLDTTRSRRLEATVTSSGQAANTTANYLVEFPTLSPADPIFSFLLLHDGNPRFFPDTYDNWDVRRVRISNLTTRRWLYDSRFDLNYFRGDTRFTGSLHGIFMHLVDLGRVDFTLSPLTTVAGAPLRFRASNLSSTVSGLAQLTCQTPAREETTSPVLIGPSSSLEVTFPSLTRPPFGTRFTCYIRHAVLPGERVELRTGNNVMHF